MCIDPGKENHCFPRIKNFQNLLFNRIGDMLCSQVYKLSIENKNL